MYLVERTQAWLHTTGELQVVMFGDAERARELLRGAGRPWETAAGEFRHRRNGRLVSAAFEAAGPHRGVSRAASMRDEPAEVEKRLTFRYDRNTGDLDIDVTANDVGRLDALRSRGGTIRARYGSQWTRIPSGRLLSIGGTEFLSLLQPVGVLDNVDLAVAAPGEAVVAGRRCLAVDATMRPPDPFGHSLGAPELFAMGAGGTHFRLYLDDAVGILLRVEKLHDGSVAEIAEFATLLLDG